MRDGDRQVRCRYEAAAFRDLLVADEGDGRILGRAEHAGRQQRRRRDDELFHVLPPWWTSRSYLLRLGPADPRTRHDVGVR